MPTTSEPQLNVEIVDFAYSGFLSILKVSLRHSLFAGGMSPVISRELMERGQAVAVLLYDQQRDAVIMIEQFRIGAIHDSNGAWLLELVAGMIEEGEQPEQVAQRESMEESGCEIKKLELIGNYYVSPGGCSEKIMLYFAAIDSHGLDGTIAGVDHESEDIRVRVLPWGEVETMLTAGEINNATALIGLQWLQIQKLANKL
jgi:ADP-ribose pyrophosphatase